MRPLEIAALLFLGLGLALFLVPAERRPFWARFVPIAAAALLVLQFLAEGHRWQLDLAYPLSAGLLLASWLGSRTSWHHAFVVVLALLGGLGLLVAVLMAVGSPMFELPEPTGPHAVGVTYLHVEDLTREETFTPDPADHRELMLTVWYPAAEVSDSQEPVAYWQDVEEAGPLMARLAGEVIGLAIRDNTFDHYADVATHSYADAPIAAEPRQHPVLVYSHGYGVARPSSNTALMEELASHGYWVASVAHTYETPAVVFEDGRVAGWDTEAVGGVFSGIEDPFFERFVGTEDPQGRDELVREFLTEQRNTSSSMKVWNADTQTVVDEIERIASGERDTPFVGRLDLDRMGVLGMSFGGATAGVFCVEDARCKAGLNLDGFHFGDGMADAVVRVPFMILSGRYGKIPINEFFFRHAAGPAYIARIDGSTHMNFTDTSITSPTLRWLGALGEIDGDRMLHIMNVYVLSFFDHYLRGEPSPLLEGDSADYPEVELLSRNRES